MNRIFDGTHKKLGFGLMRLPMIGEEIDIPQLTKMVDVFLANGFWYFDTAHGYHNGKSETAIRECLTKRYPRDAYILTDKLSLHFFQSQEEIRPLFQKQLDACGVAYFDFYLMHALSAVRMPHFRKTRAFETVAQLKAEGKIRHIGISFHDTAEVLDQILTEYPQIEIVQLQFNYLDYNDPKVQSRKCYEVCRKHHKPVLVMEPVKGGILANLPQNAEKVLMELGNRSSASYAIRYAAGFEGVQMVLSGMSSLEQLEDNLNTMNAFHPLSTQEQRAISRVTGILHSQEEIPCTGCRYCTEVCPQKLPIPDILSQINASRQNRNTKNIQKYDCIQCGECERICPQNLDIRNLLIAAEELRI